MKILMVNQSTELYGSDRSLLGMIEYFLENSTYSIHLIVPNQDGPLLQELEKLNSIYEERFGFSFAPNIKISRKVISFCGLFTFTQDICSAIKYIWNNRKWLKSFDVIHTNAVSVLLGALISKSLGIWHVWNVREIINEPKLLSFMFIKTVNLFSDQIISNSKQTHNWIKCNNLESKKYTYINNGVESLLKDKKQTKLTDAAESLLYANPSSFVISLVGRLNSWKGQKVAIKILFQLVKIQHKDVVLLLVGDAHVDNQDVEKEISNLICELQLDNRVCITGFVNNVSDYYLKSDLIIVPSQKPEPFGRVAIEAMSCAKTVVASKHGGLASIFQNGVDGYLINPFDLQSFVSTIQTLIEQPETKKRIETQARKSYLNNFTADRCYADYLIKYKSIEEEKND